MKLGRIFIILLVALVAIAGSILTSWGMNWYKSINLPSWTPSGSIIGTVWTILFILSAMATIIVWNQKKDDRIFYLTLSLFAINGALNVFWSFLFFVNHFLSTAIWSAGLLGISVLGLIILIWPRSKLAAILLVPYFGWVGFATYLTYMVWLMNK